ncbi:polyketide synthase [Penicillium chermesinum]|uniref:Polyketide synthase n=1 Tax=Penicillium chermesinum TaxID=63820 RepID=A0A9W9TP63_9EURO|nr:polyketide synthase [Penicillium chermesinum]KAJ5233183.1 polyketide synthase [Penicillium chermesinum]
MLENQAVTPQVNYERPNPKVPLDIWNLQIPLRFEKKDLRRISINSFGRAYSPQNNANGVNGTSGINGTNGVHGTNHIDSGNSVNGANGIQKANGVNGTASDFRPTADRPRVFILSGAEEQSCHQNAERLTQYLLKAPAASLDESDGLLDRLAITVNKRTVHEYNASIIAYDQDDLVEQLEILQQTPIAVRAPFKEGARVGYVFGGQGAQYYNMGREMIKDWPAFRQSLDRANAHLQTMGCEWDILTELSHEKAEDSHVDEPLYGQTLSTVVQLALVDTLASLDLTPSSTVGHSSGEIAAAYAVGALSFEDALTVSYHRGRLTSQLIGSGVSGGMLAVGLSPKVAQTYIDQIKATDASGVKIACYNSPTSVTLSGGNSDIAAVAALLQEDDVFHRKLRTRGAAYHSQMMQAIEEEYKSAIAHIQPRPLAGNMISSLHGKKLSAGLILDGEYWARNLVSPVLFSGALKAMVLGDKQDSQQHDLNVDLLLEVGPHSQMQGAVKEVLQQVGSSTRVHYLSCLKRKASACESMLRTVGELFALGASVNVHQANAGFVTQLPAMLDDVPPYAFNHDQRHWHDSRISHEFTHRQFLPHELLGNLAYDVNPTEPRWRRIVNLKEMPWLQHHLVQGQVIFPAAGYLAMAMEAMRRFTAFKAETQSKATLGYSFGNCSFVKALVLREDDTDTEICLSLRPETQSAKGSWQDWKEFRIFSTSSGNRWSEHCRGRIRVVTDNQMLTDCLSNPTVSVKERILASIHHPITPVRFYAAARQVGMEWYAPFHNVVSLEALADSSVATNKMPSLLPSAHPFGEKSYVVHPGMLDSTLFHGVCASLLVERETKAPMVPVFIEQLSVSTALEVPEGTELRTFSMAQEKGTSWSGQIELGAQPMMSYHGLRVAQLPANEISSRALQLSHSPEWVGHFPSMNKAQVIAHCTKSLSAGSSRYRNIALNAAVRAHVERALKLIQSDQVADGFQRVWYQWMQSFAATEPDSPELVWEARVVTTSDPSVSFEAVKRIGENLDSLLTGVTDSLSILTLDDMLGKLYSEERNIRCYHQINAYCKALGVYNPSLRVLEVGGGTASATLPLLQALSHHSQPLVAQYDFTDLSTAFFPAARERLAQYGNIVNYEAFDLASSPDLQGFVPGSYDVVIACNVVHATPNIASSLEHIRQLLRPGGTLILMEITNPEPYYQLIFGSLSGWWSGVDEGRVSTAVLSEGEWKQKLEQQGFESDPVILSDYANGEGATISVFFAKAPVEAQPPLEEVSLHFTSGIVPDPSGLSLGVVAEHLRQSPGLGVRQITTGGLDSIPDIASTMVVVDPGVSEALAGRMDASLWQNFQKCALSCKGLILISRGATGETLVPEGALTIGFARSLRLEQPGIRYVTLDLDPDTPYSAISERLSLRLTKLLTSEILDFGRGSIGLDCEFAERNGQLYVNRMFHNEQLDQSIVRATARAKPEQTIFLQRSRPLHVELGVPGLMETFRWADDVEHARSLAPDEIRIECRAASINFRDVLVASGELGASATMMNDCAGTVVEVGNNMTSRYAVGDRVCSYYAQSYNNYPIVDGLHCARIPDNISFALGASLPIVWATTYHSLVNVARLQAGESILVHAAAGAVGQAAVILAKHLGAVVYATCGSPEKRARLESLGVLPEHIFTSRSAAFGPALLAVTKNQGVNVILNSLAGDLFRESLGCLASFGRFVEIGKKDFLDDALMPTKFLLRNIAFACVDLVQMINEDKMLVHRLLKDVIDLIASDKLTDQVTLRLYKMGEIESAFRLISAGKHMGKVILTADPEEAVPALPETPLLPALLPEATYILAGGFGGLGAKTSAAKACIAEMQSQGVKVLAKACDISSKEALEAVLRDLRAVDGAGPIRGVINAAMALEDVMFDQMEHRQWQASLAPKVAGTRNLDELLPTDMDFFVVLSSIAGIIGHPAQANYTAACAFQDAFMHYRRSRGQHGFAVDVGVVGDAGFVSESPAVFANMKRQGFAIISVAELLATLDYVLAARGAECQAAIGLIPETGIKTPEWLNQRHLSHLVQNSALFAGADLEGGKGSSDHIDKIRRAKAVEEVVEAVGGAVREELSKLIVTPVDRILPHRTLDSYGVDSLVAVELRNWVVGMLAADVSLLLIRESRSIEALTHLVARDRQTSISRSTFLEDWAHHTVSSRGLHNAGFYLAVASATPAPLVGSSVPMMVPRALSFQYSYLDDVKMYLLSKDYGSEPDLDEFEGRYAFDDY